MYRRIAEVCACGIDEAYGVVSHIGIDIRTVGNSVWIATRPAPQPGDVIARPLVVQAGFIIALLPGVAIPLGSLSLAAHRFIGRAAVRRVLLIGHDPRAMVEFQGGGTEVVRELIP